MKNLTIISLLCLAWAFTWVSCQQDETSTPLPHDEIEGTFYAKTIEVENQNNGKAYTLERSHANFFSYTTEINLERVMFQYGFTCIVAPSLSKREKGTWEKNADGSYTLHFSDKTYRLTKASPTTLFLEVKSGGYKLKVTLDRAAYDLFDQLNGNWEVNMFYIKRFSDGASISLKSNHAYYKTYLNHFKYKSITFDGKGGFVRTNTDGEIQRGTYSKLSTVTYELSWDTDLGTASTTLYDEVGNVYLKTTDDKQELRIYFIKK